MRNLIVLLITTMAIQSHADTNLAKITFQKGSLRHTYELKSEKKVYALSLQENRRKPIVKKINQLRADDLMAQLNRIAWRSEYRKPASQQKCTDYAIVSIQKDNPVTICQENRVATAQAYGFLNKLNKLVKQ